MGGGLIFRSGPSFARVRLYGMGLTTTIINPRRMCKGYGSRSVCVCLSVCYQASGYIPHFQVQNAVS